jgi:lipoteichoic acid synthase
VVSGNNKSNVLSFLGALLSRRDWVYLLSLLVPFVVYNLSLKAYAVASPYAVLGLVQTLDLMRSDVFFNLGYALLGIGLFAAARRGPLRWAVVFLLHVATMLVVVVTTCAHQYFQQNGATLNYGTIAEWVPELDRIVPMLARGAPLSALVLLAAALFYAALGPPLVTRAAERWRGWPRTYPAGGPGISFLGAFVLFLLASGFLSLSLPAGSASENADGSFARDPFVNVVLTGRREAPAEAGEPGTDSATEYPAADIHLAQTPQTEKRNVVLIHLESARVRSVTPYNRELQTMPFLDELAKSSLLAERAYVVVPRSSKGNVAINCGIEPALWPSPEFEPDGIPANCLADLLKEQGYRTAFFQSTSNTMDTYSDVANNFGYEEFYSSEVMDTEGFRVTNTFGYEEDVMLEPSERWLRTHAYNGPFLVQYLTGTGHYDYECLPNRYGYEYFSEDEELDRYHNCLRMLDFFLRNLFDQYKRLGLYEDTIFVLYGDHGEGFREHGRYMHGDTIWEEGLRVPLIIHDPKRLENGQRVQGLSSQIDVLPTVLEMMGYEVENGEYPGYSLLHELPEDRTLMFSCISSRRCLASINGYEKYIYHYGDRPDEFYDLSEDPLEERNLAGERDKKELDERREELLAWRTRLNAQHGRH